MSLDKDRLGNAYADRVIAIMGGGAPGAADEAELRTLMKALADETVKEITANAIVTTTVTGTLPVGPVAAAGTGGVT